MNKRKPLSVGKQVLFTFGTLCAVLLVIGGLFLFSLRSIERSNQLQPSRALDKYVETDAGEIAGATNRFIAKIRIIGDVLVGLTILIALGTGFAVVRVTRRLKGDNETLQNEIQERQYTEQQLRVQTTALDAAANAIVITNHDGTIQSVNPAFTAMTGYTAQEVLGQNLRILKSGKQDEAFYRNLWQTISSGQVWSGELANRRKDGSLYAEEMTITPLRDAGGVIARYIAIKQDITKRKRAAERLQQSEGRMRAISDSVQDAILVMDPEGCITFWNPAAERILGYTSAEAIGQDLHDLIVPVRFHAAHHAAYPAFLETGQGAAVGKTLDLEARRKDGLEIPIQLSLSAFQMKDGWHAVGIIRDTTELKKAEMEIQHQAAFARFNPNPVLELSAGGEITFFNRAAGAMARALGRETPAQMLPPNTAAIVRECLAADAPKTRLETQIGERVISWSFFPVKFKHKVHCYAGDTTERKQAEEALRRSETKFRALYDSTGDAVMLLDKNGFFDCNPATLAMFGCATREEFCLKHPADVSPPMQPGGTDSLTLARQQIATATEKGSHRFEWMHQRADTGVAFPAEVLLSAMELDGKQVFQATVRDITERKRSEESQRLQSAALEAAANAIIITDQSGNIQSVNPAFTALTGYTAQEAVGQNPRILKSGQQDEVFYRNLWQTISSGQVWSGQLTNRRKDGSLYAEEMTITPLRDADGAIARYIAIKQDITERKRAEEALRASRQIIEGIINDIPVRVFWKDKNLVYLGCNTVFARDAGFADPKDVIGKDDYQMGWREQAEKYRGDDRQIIESGSSKLQIEEPQTTPEGNTITLLTSKIPLRGSKGEIIGLLGTYLDITERRRAAEELQWKTALLEAQVNSSPDGILVVDQQGKKILQNQRTADLLKMPQHIADDKDDETQRR